MEFESVTSITNEETNKPEKSPADLEKDIKDLESGNKVVYAMIDQLDRVKAEKVPTKKILEVVERVVFNEN